MATPNMDEFKVGDRVVFIQDLTDPFYPKHGSTGTVIRTDGDGCPCVKWDKPLPCGRTATYCCDYRMEKYVEPQKVVIWQDPHDMLRVVAKDILTGETAEARCHPEEQDEFNFELGAHIALGRLFGHEPAIVELGIHIDPDKIPVFRVPDPTPLYNGRVVCVECRDPLFSDWWTVGKVYEIKDGVIKDNRGVPRDPVTCVKELPDVTATGIKFIEIKE